MLVTFWNDRIHIESMYKLCRRIASLSQIKTIVSDCFINSCCAFIGTDFESAQSCPFCHEPRFDGRNSTRITYKYIPLTSHMMSMFLNSHLVDKMKYRSNFPSDPTVSEDIFSGSHYQQLLSDVVIVDEACLAHKFFTD